MFFFCATLRFRKLFNMLINISAWILTSLIHTDQGPKLTWYKQ